MADPLEGLCRALGFGEDPTPVLEAVAAVYAELDRDLETRARDLALPCGAGCDACCHEAVFLSAPEFMLVAQEVLRWPPSERRDLVTRMREIADRFEDELDLLESIEPGAERDEVAARVKFTCPLLSAQGTCRVYAVRELNARTFGQTVDETSGAPYGCDKTHARLAVLPEVRVQGLLGARAARRRLVEAVPNTASVRVYPWWFNRYAAFFAG